MSFKISGGSYILSQNTLRLTKKFEKCIPSFMESLIADFMKFFSAIAKFSFLKGKLGTSSFHFLSCLAALVVTRTFKMKMEMI